MTTTDLNWVYGAKFSKNFSIPPTRKFRRVFRNLFGMSTGITYDQCIECLHSTGSIEIHLVSSDKLHGVTNTRSAAEVDITHYNLLGTSSLFNRNSKFWPLRGYDRRTRNWTESRKEVQDLSTRHRSRPLDDVCCPQMAGGIPVLGPRKYLVV